MTKPTDEELEALRMRVYGRLIEGARAAANRALFDAGIAFAAKRVRELADAESCNPKYGALDGAADELDALAEER